MSNYDKNSIKVLKGLEGIRKRSGMYSVMGENAVMHLLTEAIDNVVDEFMEGHGDTLTVTLDGDGFVSVQDNARGIPCGYSKEHDMDILEVVLTNTHAGGKFNTDTYKTSGGLNGVGIKVIAALSEQMITTVHREGKKHEIIIEESEVVQSPKVIGTTDRTGTTIKFKPSSEIYDDITFKGELIETKLKTISYLYKGFRCVFVNNIDNTTHEFYSEKGVKSFIDDMVSDSKEIGPLVENVRTANGVDVEFAIQWTDSPEEDVKVFVNGVHTEDGGTPLTGYKNAIRRVMKKYVKGKVETDDYREGVKAVVSIKISNPLFENQVKSRIVNKEAVTAVGKVIADELGELLDNAPKKRKPIVDRIMLAKKVREATVRARTNVTRKSNLSLGLTLAGKLIDCAKKDSSDTCLYITEGDSASGGLRLARDPQLDAILPLKGKIINAKKATRQKVLANDEVQAMIASIGSGYGKNFNIDECRYEKIILVADRDVDGEHITLLALTFFREFMPELINQGRVFLANPPLYKFTHGKKSVYLNSEDELNAAIAKAKGNYTYSYFKGLGELNSDQLFDTVLNREVRTLVRIDNVDELETFEVFNTLMGDNIEARKKFVAEGMKGLELHI